VTEIRSYRSVFDLERRIYRVDRLRLNPGGIPVRGIVYCLVILLGLTLAGAVPLLGVAVRVLPWYLRDLALPVGVAGVLTMIRVEGRPFHLAAGALARHALGPRHLVGMRPCAGPGQRWRPGELLVLPDGSDASLRRLRYSGPGAVRVMATHRCTVRRAGSLAGAVGRLTGHPRLTLGAALSRRECAPRRGSSTRRAVSTGRTVSTHQELTAGSPPGGRVIVLARGVRLRVGRAD
jgi:hypothetical protein